MSVLAAFAVVRLRFHGRIWVARLILFKYLLPTTLIYIPLFLVVNGLGLANTLQSLIFTYLSFSIPFATWLLMGYFRGIPPELEEQAMIDGCSRIGAMVRVLLPIAAPGVVAASIFTFTGAWNEFLLALVFINRPALQTVPVKLSSMIVGDQYVWGAIMAGRHPGLAAGRHPLLPGAALRRVPGWQQARSKGNPADSANDQSGIASRW